MRSPPSDSLGSTLTLGKYISKLFLSITLNVGTFCLGCFLAGCCDFNILAGLQKSAPFYLDKQEVVLSWFLSGGGSRKAQPVYGPLDRTIQCSDN